MANALAVPWFDSLEGLTALAHHRCDPPKGRRGPRIGRAGKPASRVLGPVANEVVLSTELDPFMPLKALARYAGLSVRKLREYLIDSAHPLPHYRIGGKIVVRRSDYDTWAAQYRQMGNVDVDKVVAEALSDLRGAA